MAAVKSDKKLARGNIGERARDMGLKPKYLAGGYWKPAKKRQRKS